jgi:hypothetical protein
MEEIPNSDEDWLSPGALHDLSELVRERKAEATDAEKLRNEFIKYVDSGRTLPPQLLQWVSRGFMEQQRRKSLEQALGLIRPRAGKPKADPELMTAIALTILDVRLKGKLHKQALDVARRKWRCRDTKLSRAWKTHKIAAFHELRIRRAVRNTENRAEWTADEINILRYIFKKEKHTPASWLK